MMKVLLVSPGFAAEKPEVIFIGGHGSAADQMQEWKTLAQKNPSYSSFQFQAIALPSKRFSYEDVLKDGLETINRLVKEIDESSGDQEFILVGHSSGSAIGNEVARRVKKSKRSQVKLVVLDGFFPMNVPKEIETTCWSAVAAETGAPTINTAYMKNCANYQEMKPYGCQDKMCLHFALVNSSAPKVGVNSSNYPLAGYKNLSPNLNWLSRFVPEQHAQRTPKTAH